ncbi:MAG: alpha-L-rhamnosidase [Muricauda sp.]|nr:alpha-L-rhamnosidase [Allomuricauda sp.]
MQIIVFNHLIRQVVCFLVLCLLVGSRAGAQQVDTINEELLTSWEANWISHPTVEGHEYGVYFFKRNFTQVGDIPEEFIVHLSADNRYKFYVNGTYVANGPARGDQMNWRFESLNIAPYLKNGENTLSAVVWNFSDYRPLAQHTIKTGFVLQGNGDVEQRINTDEQWSVMQSGAHKPTQIDQRIYLITGAGEDFDSSEYPWGWMGEDFKSDEFVPAKSIARGVPKNGVAGYGIVPPHILVQRDIPLMEEKFQRFESIRRTSTKESVPNFISGKEKLIVPPHTKLTVLVDQGHLTNAYPIVSFSKGTGSQIVVTYAEALFDDHGQKGNRNDVNGKSIEGNINIIRPDGQEGRVYEPLWWRTFRYVQLDIETKEQPLVLDDFASRFTGYPFKQVAEFGTKNPLLDKIWDVSWRTQRLCSGENYFDCPYYEQLQYIGDTRIQSLVTTYVSGDSRLYKNALESFQHSQESFGLTQSRYPSNETQFIPTFSLIWITMLHDYWMLLPDEEFVGKMMPNVLNILNWFEKRSGESGLVEQNEWWMFVDWVDTHDWVRGVPPGAEKGNSILLNLQYAYTLQYAIEMLEVFGHTGQADVYRSRLENIRAKVKELAWDEQKELFSDTPKGEKFSQHTNIMAILANVVSGEKAASIMKKVLEDESLAKTSYYFSFYLTEALRHTGMEEKYLGLMGRWEEMLDNGLTTFAEKQEPTRSDCHAWSASPMYHFLSMVCGIQPAEPGFQKIHVEPHLGKLEEVNGKVPHHLGEIEFDLKKRGQNGLKGKIELPKGLDGTLIWNGRNLALKEGMNDIQID